MIHPPSASGQKPAVVLRCAATAGLGALVLSLGAPALSQAPASPVSPGGWRGWGLPGPGRMGTQSMDQHFIAMMIPHHDGAIAMADLALSLAKRPEIKSLARSIKDSQTWENNQMRAWCRQWYGGAVPAWGGSYGRGVYSGWGGWMGGSGGMMMGRGGGMGMMGTDVEWLKTAPDFDRAFIEQMIPHHRMGVMMASMAQTNSQHPELRELQQAMVKAQSREIEQMAQWYRQWYGASSR